jgi:PAS domain S-box-containing protein
MGAERLFGFRSVEMPGEPFYRLYNTCESDTPQRHLRAALEQGHVTDECQQVRKNGTQFWATADVTLLRNEQGDPRGYAVITRDITERRQQREEIEQREVQLNAFFSNAPVGLAIIDKDLLFRRINGPFAELNGLDSREQIGRPLRAVIADLSHQIEPLLRRVASTGEPLLTQEIKGPIPSSPGMTGWWLKSLFPITKDGDVVTPMGMVVQDIAGLKRAETAVRQLSGRLLQIRDDERRRLARDLHDSLGQTLTAVKMNLSYLGRDTSNFDERGRTAVAESKELVDNSLKEVRTSAPIPDPKLITNCESMQITSKRLQFSASAAWHSLDALITATPARASSCRRSLHRAALWSTSKTCASITPPLGRVQPCIRTLDWACPQVHTAHSLAT